MGFFDRLFGGKREERRPPKRRPPPEEKPEGPAFVPDSFPFDGEVRVYHADYKRLTTGWWKVSAATPEEWQTKIDDMQKSMRQHFGQFQTQEGRLVPRWSQRTWEIVRQRLRVGRR